MSLLSDSFGQHNMCSRLCCGAYNVSLRSFYSHTEREPLRHCEGDGKVTFTRPFLMMGNVTFDEQVNILERYCKGHLYKTFTNLNGSLSKIKGP